MKLKDLLMKVKNTVYTMNIHEQESTKNLTVSADDYVMDIRSWRCMHTVQALEPYYNREVVSIYANSYGELEIVIAKE